MRMYLDGCVEYGDANVVFYSFSFVGSKSSKIYDIITTIAHKHTTEEEERLSLSHFASK